MHISQLRPPMTGPLPQKQAKDEASVISDQSAGVPTMLHLVSPPLLPSSKSGWEIKKREGLKSPWLGCYTQWDNFGFSA